MAAPTTKTIKELPKRTHHKTKSLMSSHELKFHDILSQLQLDLKEKHEEFGSARPANLESSRREVRKDLLKIF